MGIKALSHIIKLIAGIRRRHGFCLITELSTVVRKWRFWIGKKYLKNLQIWQRTVQQDCGSSLERQSDKLISIDGWWTFFKTGRESEKGRTQKGLVVSRQSLRESREFPDQEWRARRIQPHPAREGYFAGTSNAVQRRDKRTKQFDTSLLICMYMHRKMNI